MENLYIGEIILFAGNFAPRSTVYCNGQLLSIAQNTALFSILGTTYGGDGRTTFGIPDLRGRVALHPGTGPGLSTRKLGQRSGTETNSLNLNQLAAHTHIATMQNEGGISIPVNTTSGDEDEQSPGAGVLANTGSDSYSSSGSNGVYSGAAIPVTGASSIQVGQTGAGQPINNMQPFLGLNYIICTQGAFPSRS
jgi:microcystin-dependent protein